MNTINPLKSRSMDFKFHPLVMFIRQLRKSFVDFYPSIQLRLNKQKRQGLIGELKACSTVDSCIKFTQKHMGAGSCQIPWEIESTLNLIAESKPRVLCEIGTFDGGTSLLFSRFLPTLGTMLCIDLYVKNKEFLRLLAPPKQSLHFYDMPSYNEGTVKKVQRHLNGRKIDVLFIDGDHRYEGVKKDFLHYRSLVKEGGLILLHDIKESGEGGRAWAGGVPKFWKELAALYPHHEFVDSPDQHGFGIGVLTYSRKIRLPAGFETSF